MNGPRHLSPAMVKTKPKSVKAKRALRRLALGLGDPRLVGVGGGRAVLAIGIGANLMQASGIDASPHRLSAASPHVTSRRNETPPHRLSRA